MASSPLEDLDDRQLRSHASALRRLALTLVRQHDVAEDASQEAWLAAVQFERGGIRSIRAWLGSATRQAARNIERTEWRVKLRESRAAGRSTEPAPEQRLEREEILQAVAAAVTRLSEPSREAVVLHFYEGCTSRQIASRLEVPLATVRSRLRRGLVALGRDLAAHGDRDWRAGLIAAAAGRPRRSSPRRRFFLVATSSTLLLLLFMELRFEHSLIGWALARAPHGPGPTHPPDPMHPTTLALAASVAASSLAVPTTPQNPQSIAATFERVIESCSRSVQPCGSNTCGRGAEPRCEHCTLIAVGNDRFQRLRAVLAEDVDAWDVLGARSRALLSEAATAPMTREGVLNVLILCRTEAASEHFASLLKQCAESFTDTHLIALTIAGRADAREQLIERADTGALRACAYLATLGDDRGRLVLQHVLREGRRPLDLVIAASALRALGDQAAFDVCVERLRDAILVPLDEGEHLAARHRLIEAEHLLRSFDPESGPRTFLGGPGGDWIPRSQPWPGSPGPRIPCASRCNSRSACSPTISQRPRSAGAWPAWVRAEGGGTVRSGRVWRAGRWALLKTNTCTWSDDPLPA